MRAWFFLSFNLCRCRNNCTELEEVVSFRNGPRCRNGELGTAGAEPGWREGDVSPGRGLALFPVFTALKEKEMSSFFRASFHCPQTAISYPFSLLRSPVSRTFVPSRCSASPARSGRGRDLRLGPSRAARSLASAGTVSVSSGYRPRRYQ